MSAISPRENQIMDLWDAGHPIHQIAEQLGLTLDHATTVVTRFGRTDEPRLARRDAERGSAMLLAGIQGLRAKAQQVAA
jgi:DNA-binding NarL/FixJ family response regulator